MNDETTRYTNAVAQYVTALALAHPDIPYPTVITMAADAVSAERTEADLRAGTVTYDQSLIMVGSYSRMAFALTMQEAGFATRDHLLDLMPDLWPACDPDDTDLRFLALWREAWERNRHRPVGAALPPPGPNSTSRRWLPIYRGQSARDPVGFAWSLDFDVALRFANGAGYREPGSVIEPVVYRARAARRQVLAYLTGRDESEVIVDPFDLTIEEETP